MDKKIKTSDKEVDIYRETLLRYCGRYAVELGKEYILLIFFSSHNCKHNLKYLKIIKFVLRIF